jgi:hypothetical protein
METLTTPQIIFVILIAIWTLFWKGLALWHAARKKNQVWFVVLLLINTVGILEIIYLFFVAKVKPRKLLS